MREGGKEGGEGERERERGHITTKSPRITSTILSDGGMCKSTEGSRMSFWRAVQLIEEFPKASPREVRLGEGGQQLGSLTVNCQEEKETRHAPRAISTLLKFWVM